MSIAGHTTDFLTTRRGSKVWKYFVMLLWTEGRGEWARKIKKYDVVRLRQKKVVKLFSHNLNSVWISEELLWKFLWTPLNIQAYFIWNHMCYEFLSSFNFTFCGAVGRVFVALSSSHIKHMQTHKKKKKIGTVYYYAKIWLIQFQMKNSRVNQ